MGSFQKILRPTKYRAVDTSGNNNYGQIYSGRALEFDGFTDYLNIYDSDAADGLFGSFLKTFACWINFKDVSTEQIIVGGWLSDSSISVEAGKIGCASTISDDNDVMIDTAVRANTWYRLVVVSNVDVTDASAISTAYADSFSNFSIYLNGIKQTLEAGNSYRGSNKMLLGVRHLSSTFEYYFDGIMSDVQGWDKVWTQEDATFDYLNPESLALNNGGTSLTESNLKLWYPMQDGHARENQSYIMDGANVEPASKNHATTVFHGDELAVNGDMETFPTLHATNDDTFTTDDEDGSQQVTMVTEGTINNSGSKSAKCALKFGSTSGYITYNKTDYVEGRTYRAEVYMRAGGSQTISAFQMFADDSIRGEDGTDGAAITPDEDFAIAYVEFVAAATTMMINMKFTGTATHFAFIDDFSIKEVGIATGWTDADQQLDIPQTALQSYNQLAWFPGVDTGTDMDVDCTSDSDIDEVFDGGGTFSAWIFSNGIGNGTGRIADKGRWLLYLANEANETCQLKFKFYDDGSPGSSTTRTTEKLITFGKWQHVAVTYNATDNETHAALYINGEPVVENEETAGDGDRLPDAGYNLFIGNIVDGSRTFDGSITEASLWTTVLTDAQISELYNSGKALDATTHSVYTSASTNLKGYWRNNGLATWTDYSDYENHGTVNGLTETLLLPAGVDVSRDTQGFLMNRKKDTNSLNPPRTDSEMSSMPYTLLRRSPLYTGSTVAEFSWACWTKWKTFPNSDQYLLDNAGTSSTSGFYVRAKSSHKIEFKVYVDASSTLKTVDYDLDLDEGTYDSSEEFVVDKWIHLTGTYKGSISAGHNLYANGKLVATTDPTTTTMNAAASDPFGIGYSMLSSGLPGSSKHPDFAIDDVLIYDKLLTIEEVLRIYNAGKRSHR